MKKIALLFALFAGMFTTAMAQESKDSIWVVQGDTAATAIAVADGDYITFSKPALWHKVVTDAPTYYYYNSAYTWNYTYKTSIQQYGTQNYFYIDNFLNSGSGFTFKLMSTDGTTPDEIADISTFDGYISPVANEGVDVTNYGSYTGCYFYTPTSYGWTDAVNNVTYDYWYFYGDSYFAAFNGTGKYAEIMCYVTIGNTGAYSELYIDWR